MALDAGPGPRRRADRVLARRRRPRSAVGEGTTIDHRRGKRSTARPPAPAPTGDGRGDAQGGPPAAGGSGIAFSRTGERPYFRARNNLFAAAIGNAGNGAATGAAAGGSRGGRGAAASAADAAANPATATARQVTYTANLEVDHKALRAQVFNEGWRIMKNRFYDAKMHGANWNAVKEMYEPLLFNVVDDDELHTIMMMMMHLNASHTGVNGGRTRAPPVQTRSA